ncbi:MAG: sugar ABC transporter permease [Chloroflexi bacterium]|nr:sugar ABC transporter permease [Chloroflexota bacterium]
MVTASFLIGLGTALLLNNRFRGRAVLRTIAIIPWPIPEVVAVMIWAWMFSADFGVINYFVSLVVPGSGKVGWLSDPNFALPAVSMVTIWKQFPLATVMILAGLQHIPVDHYEAAAVDGANAGQRFRYITLPGLRHVNLVLVLLLVLYTFKRVTIIFVMTGGGPGRATETLPIQTYLQSFQFFDMGYASAIGTLMLTVAMSFTLLYLALTRRDPEQA